MTIEKEFNYYANKHNNFNSNSDEVIIEDSVFLNVKFVLSKKTLLEINNVAVALRLSPDLILARYLQNPSLVELTPIDFYENDADEDEDEDVEFDSYLLITDAPEYPDDYYQESQGPDEYNENDFAH